MYTDDDLEAASAAGVLAPEAVAAFRAFIAARRNLPAADEEHFRLLTGFNDIFVAIAAGLILVAIGWLTDDLGTAISAAAVAAASWGLAEYFTRRRRMALPSILLLLTFVGGVFVALAAQMVPNSVYDLDQSGLRVAACAGLSALAAYGHWWRFRVPITVAAGCGALAATLLALFAGTFPSRIDHWMMPLVLVSGLAIFAFAMRWDASDRERTTRRSDVAFWLHLGAAPLIVHPAFSLLGVLDHQSDAAQAIAALSIYLVLALIALAIDRRALLISALAYVLYAISALLEASGSISESFALTALVIGSALLLLSALWHQARVRVVKLLPGTIRAWLPAV